MYALNHPNASDQPYDEASYANGAPSGAANVDGGTWNASGGQAMDPGYAMYPEYDYSQVQNAVYPTDSLTVNQYSMDQPRYSEDPQASAHMAYSTQAYDMPAYDAQDYSTQMYSTQAYDTQAYGGQTFDTQAYDARVYDDHAYANSAYAYPQAHDALYLGAVHAAEQMPMSDTTRNGTAPMDATPPKTTQKHTIKRKSTPALPGAYALNSPSTVYHLADAQAYGSDADLAVSSQAELLPEHEGLDAFGAPLDPTSFTEEAGDMPAYIQRFSAASDDVPPSWTSHMSAGTDEKEGDGVEAHAEPQQRTGVVPEVPKGEAIPDTQHFGPAPPMGWQKRRHHTKRNVPLTHGNFVLNCPIPTKLGTFVKRLDAAEFTHMRYSAVTGDPDEFVAQRFTLRQTMANRHTELFICITMYNEDERLFCRTLHGVMKNIAHLTTRSKSRMWGAESWTKVVVAIVADGRRQIHPRVLDCLSALGVYQEGVAKTMVDEKPVSAHLYEYTTQLSIDSKIHFCGAENGLVPVQLLFCLKEKNAKKINSHRWFFNAFAATLKPNVCVLLDAGTVPEHKSIYSLWKAFDVNSSVAGACGEIAVDTGGPAGLGLALLNPLVAAQNFEYKISNILDKTLESVLGYISVLPGAFSAYRYIALLDDPETKRGPLASYFKGEFLHGGDADVFTSNMYLAEDRILCFELAAKAHSHWVMQYVQSARGITDVPNRVPEFVSQRRRWLNGAFYSAVYALTHSFQYVKTSHSVWRKCVLAFATLYSVLNLLVSWFGIGNFYIFFRVLTRGLEAPSFGLAHIGIANEVAHYVYIGTLIATFVLALGNRPQGSTWKYTTVVVLFGLLTLYMLVAGIACMCRLFIGDHNSHFAQLVVGLIATYGTYAVASIIALDPLHLLTSNVQYLLLTPTFVNVLNIYAFCNVHDISWGTKGDSVAPDLGKVTTTAAGMAETSLPSAQSDIDTLYDDALASLRERETVPESGAEKMSTKKLDYYKNIRTNVLLLWTLSNALLVGLILDTDLTGTFDPHSGDMRTKTYVLIILVVVAVMSGIRFTGSVVYQILRAVYA